MAEQSKVVVMTGRKPVQGVLNGLQAEGTLREATTGRAVTLPQVWAVAAPQPVRMESLRARKAAAACGLAEDASQENAVPDEELGFYRKYTERLLQRYLQMTMEAGRVSSLMGREIIGGKASSYRIHGFDDAVIFRLDVEKCLRKLERDEREVIRRVAIQEYTQTEAAELLGVSVRTVVNRYGRALDRLTGILMRARLLDPVRACQAAAMARRS
ncbi:MAG TPA: sigma factor-like helix-turn-helix DNA-binding protein [Acidobacteriaceae bacterium]|nr:sigma factor-like helix-turn-helix DNA-binding protein [Acidobacteriaceae bacterium]